MITTVLAGLGMLGALVVIHEFGHFVAAKTFRVSVPIFSVGMGPRVVGVVWGGTDYRLSLLPVGGYVKLAGADPFGEEDPDAMVDPDTDFMQKPIWQRLIVMLAGPAFNLMLPFVVFSAVRMAGEPQPDTSVGMVVPGSMAEAAGFRDHDVITDVAGAKVTVWTEVLTLLQSPPAGPMTFTVDRAGAISQLTLDGTAFPRNAAGDVDLDVLGLASPHLSAEVGVDDPGSPAAKAGLHTGDVIDQVDGKKVADWDELRVALAGGTSHQLSVLHADPNAEDGSGIAALSLTIAADAAWSPRAGEVMPDTWGVLPIVLFVGDIPKDKPAALAGVQRGDRLAAVDGKPVRSWVDLTHDVAMTVGAMTEDAQPRPLALDLIRDGKPVHIEFTPLMDHDFVGGVKRFRPVMGIGQYPSAYVAGPTIRKYYGPVEALTLATSDFKYVATGTLSMLGNLVTGQAKPSEGLGGPIEMVRMAGQGAQRGIFSYLRLMGILSISLGIFNLLPVPVLDGGQILFYTIEGIRGRPLSLALREKLQMAGVLALVSLMLMVGVLDVTRWLWPPGT